MAQLSVPILQREQILKVWFGQLSQEHLDEVEITPEYSICQTCKKGVSGTLNSVYFLSLINGFSLIRGTKAFLSWEEYVLPCSKWEIS